MTVSYVQKFQKANINPLISEAKSATKKWNKQMDADAVALKSNRDSLFSLADTIGKCVERFKVVAIDSGDPSGVNEEVQILKEANIKIGPKVAKWVVTANAAWMLRVSVTDAWDMARQDNTSDDHSLNKYFNGESRNFVVLLEGLHLFVCAHVSARGLRRVKFKLRASRQGHLLFRTFFEYNWRTNQKQQTLIK